MSGIRCRVVPGLHEHDHYGVLASIRVNIPESTPERRKVHRFSEANWDGFQKYLAGINWSEEFNALDADEMALQFTDLISSAAGRFIPSKWILYKAYSHPWVDNNCRNALRRKHAALGTVDFVKCRDECSHVFSEAYRSYIGRTRRKLRSMSRSSRGWWRVANSLMTKAGTAENIPPLKRHDSSWATSPEEKASELASVFRAKAQLPELVENEFSEVKSEGVSMGDGFLRIRVRDVKRILRKLDASSGTGPDLLPARILKTLASELALPTTLLVRKILNDGRWPLCWRLHWVHPVYKRKSKADARNYRGVHLTPQLSKVAERAIGAVFIPCTESNGLFGPHQYAYSRGKGYKDVLAVNVCHWISSLER